MAGCLPSTLEALLSIPNTRQMGIRIHILGGGGYILLIPILRERKREDRKLKVILSYIANFRVA